MTLNTLTTLHMNRQQQAWQHAAPEELVRARQVAQAPEALLLRRMAQDIARCDRHTLAQARQIQRTEAMVEVLHTLRPRTPSRVRGWRIESAWLPAEGVGGDFYDLVPLADGRIGVLIGDVAGKGATAAIVMALVRPILRAEAATGATPAEVLRRANEQITAIMPAGCFLTTLYAVLNPMSGVLRVANAGHNQPYVRTQSGVERIDATGFPLGLMDDVIYEEQSLILKQGDTLLLTTDGITDARNSSREHFGFARLQQVLAQWDGATPGIIKCVLDAVRTFADDFETQDDVAILALQRQ
jgi:serine phosphatase RsbU (regulator of sigma subunit)